MMPYFINCNLEAYDHLTKLFMCGKSETCLSETHDDKCGRIRKQLTMYPDHIRSKVGPFFKLQND